MSGHAPFVLTLSFDTIDKLAKAVVALSQANASAVVVGSGAAVPQASPPPTAGAAPTPVSAPMAAPVSAATAPTPTAAASHTEGNALTWDGDVLPAYKAALTKHAAAAVQAVNQQFGVQTPLQIKARPHDWPGYVQALAALG